ncbi:MAG: hypothetical protein Alis3KO_12640 [Aliiglaciecola sp.]|uniref:DNA polymerase III subunit chi n=1 Tax=Aliiglaciecola sp. M165 TaxID=2593649 RepID=UPI00118166B5|nr:DNA polymerase III subunit chi [Aliiglaciecola sp. M165]TRY31789.1 DNA polymerase III subunit chi [Aliiglaciecola sp. M165]
MADVTFYTHEAESSNLQASTDPSAPDHWVTACEVVAQCYRNKRRCLVLCNNQQQAEALDDLLWKRPLDGFIPHNLVGEGPNGGAPVEISWQQTTTHTRPVLINLADDMPSNLQGLKHVFDFVPVEDTAKQQARERYKQYRAARFTMHSLPASSIYENQNG